MEVERSDFAFEVDEGSVAVHQLIDALDLTDGGRGYQLLSIGMGLSPSVVDNRHLLLL